MTNVIGFARTWIRNGIALNRRGDPLLMGSAIAFNSLFALVPLGIAFVSVLTLIDDSGPLAENLKETIEAAFPPDIAAFVIEVLKESSGLVTGERAIIVVISVLVAFWSGSRAVYAIQKSLRLVQGLVDERGYIHSRLVGIAVTVAAMIAIFVGYAALGVGDNAWHALSDALGIGSVSVTRVLVGALTFAWVFGMLWAVYRFGPPRPIDYSVIVAALVTTVLAIGTAAISVLLPQFESQAVAVFGSLGVVLLWFYFVGVVVVAVPIAAMSFRIARDEQGQR